MATKSDFDPREWQLLIKSPSIIYSVMIAAKGGTDEITRPEASALHNMLEDYHTSDPLIQSVLSSKVEAKVPDEIKSNPYDLGLKDLQQVGDILERKLSREDVDEFKVFLLSIGNTIAKASGEGFLGLGKKISDKEDKALNDIAAALKSTREGKGLEGAEAAQPQAERVYEVKTGDSLSKIALTFYKNADEWPRIFEANKDQINDPNLIHPGQKLRIP